MSEQNEQKEKNDQTSKNKMDDEEIIEIGKLLLERIHDQHMESNLELKRGESYLLKEKRPLRSMDLFLKKIDEENERGYILSRVNPKKIKEKYNLPKDKVKFYWLTSLPGKDNLKPSDLPYVAHSMIDFLEEDKGIIFMEGIETILKNNRFKEFLKFLDNLVDVVEIEEGILITTLDPRTLPEHRLAQIERKLTVLSTS